MESNKTEQNSIGPLRLFLDKEGQSRIIEMYTIEHLSYRKIAKIVGCHFSTVAEYVRKCGINPRNSFDWHQRKQNKQNKQNQLSPRIRLNRIEKALKSALLEVEELKNRLTSVNT